MVSQVAMSTSLVFKNSPGHLVSNFRRLGLSFSILNPFFSKPHQSPSQARGPCFAHSRGVILKGLHSGFWSASRVEEDFKGTWGISNLLTRSWRTDSCLIKWTCQTHGLMHPCVKYGNISTTTITSRFRIHGWPPWLSLTSSSLL